MPALATPNWQSLPNPIFIGPGAIYYKFSWSAPHFYTHKKEPARFALPAPLSSSPTVHLIVVDYRSGEWVIKPTLAKTKTPTSKIAESSNVVAAVNGGYFNLTDGESASFITLDGKTVADPHTNHALTTNPKLIPYLKQIFNRSEIRFLSDKQGALVIMIAPHNAPLPEQLKLKYALQAGPQLLPAITEKQEAFVRILSDEKVTDAIGSLHPAARTAFGITNDGYAMLICVAGQGQNPESKGVTIAQLSRLLSGLGCTEAINLDGGASTTMVIRKSSSAQTNGTGGQKPASMGEQASSPAPVVVCSAHPETRIKSALMLIHRP